MTGCDPTVLPHRKAINRRKPKLVPFRSKNIRENPLRSKQEAEGMAMREHGR
jgi:hypothetical protein